MDPSESSPRVSNSMPLSPSGSPAQSRTTWSKSPAFVSPDTSEVDITQADRSPAQASSPQIFDKKSSIETAASVSTATSLPESGGRQTDRLVHLLTAVTSALVVVLMGSLLGIALLIIENRDIIMPEEVINYIKTGQLYLPTHQEQFVCMDDLRDRLDKSNSTLQKQHSHTEGRQGQAEAQQKFMEDLKEHITKIKTPHKSDAVTTAKKKLTSPQVNGTPTYFTFGVQSITAVHNYVGTQRSDVVVSLYNSDSNIYNTVDKPVNLDGFFVCKTPGFYLFEVTIMNADDVDDLVGYLAHEHKGTLTKLVGLYIPRGVDNKLSVSNSAVVMLSAGDTVSLRGLTRITSTRRNRPLKSLLLGSKYNPNGPKNEGVGYTVTSFTGMFLCGV